MLALRGGGTVCFQAENASALTRGLQGLAKHVHIPDVVGQHQDEARIQRRTVGFRQPLVRIEQGFVKIVPCRQVRPGRLPGMVHMGVKYQ